MLKQYIAILQYLVLRYTAIHLVANVDILCVNYLSHFCLITQKVRGRRPRVTGQLGTFEVVEGQRTATKVLVTACKTSALCHCIKCTKWTVIQFSWKSGEREDILSLSRKCWSSFFHVWKHEALSFPFLTLYCSLLVKSVGVRVDIILQ